MQAVINDIRARATELDGAMQPLITQLSTLPDTAQSWTSTRGFMLQWLISRTSSIAALSTEIANQPEDRLLLASSNRLRSLQDQLVTLRNSVDNLVTNLANIQGWGGYDRIEGETIYAKNGQGFSIRSILDELLSSQDNALESYFAIASAARPRGIGTFAAASRSLHEQATNAGRLVEELRDSADALTKKLTAIQAKGAAVSQSDSESQRLVEEIDKRRKTAEENEQRISAAAATIENIRAQASSLEAAVREYSDRFEAFQSLLDGREASIAKGANDLSELRVRFSRLSRRN